MNASIEIQNGVKTLSNSPLDAKYFNNNGVPYTNVAEVMAQLPLALRNQGLVVNIGGVEYWWNTSDVSIEPVIKTSAAIEYSTDIEADKASTTKVSAIKTLYDWAVAKFSASIHSHSQSDITGLTTALSNKVDKNGTDRLITQTEATKLAGLNEHYKGTYPSYELLIAAVPFGVPGDEAIVDAIGIDPKKYIWDDTDGEWKLGSGTAITVEQAISEGSVNPISGGAVYSALQYKADKAPLTFPTIGEVEGVSYSGLALNAKNADKATNDSQGNAIHTTYEPAISKSIGILSWTGTAWAWVANNFITSIKTIAGKNLVGTGDVTLTKSDVGLSNVDNTSDANKEVSTATAIALDLKAMQNPGICQKCPILPADIVIDAVANTLTIATVKGGQTISAGNPIRFYTDGSGIITKHEKTAPVVFNFTNTNGVWYFHFDNTGNPVATQTPWADFNVVATVYRFYLNDQLANADKITVRAWECHLNDTSAADHAWKHAQGTQYVNGFDSSTNVLAHLNGVPTVTPNTDGRNTVVALTTGKNSDDGLEYTVTNTTAAGKFNQDLGQTITASLNATNSALFKIRTNDAAGRLSFLPATRFPFAWDVATNAPQYITAAGVRTLVPDNNWFVYYSYALQDDVQGEAIKLVSAEAAFTTWATAKDHTWKALQNLYATLKDKEIRLLYKYIFYCNKTGGQAYPVGCKYSGLVLVEDQRTQLLTFTTSGGSTGTVIASNITETTDGNVQAAIDGLRSSLAAGPANNSITNLKLAQIPTQTIKGRASSGTGDVEDLTAAQALAVIGAKSATYQGEFKTEVTTVAVGTNSRVNNIVRLKKSTINYISTQLEWCNLNFVWDTAITDGEIYQSIVFFFIVNGGEVGFSHPTSPTTTIFGSPAPQSGVLYQFIYTALKQGATTFSTMTFSRV